MSPADSLISKADEEAARLAPTEGAEMHSLTFIDRQDAEVFAAQATKNGCGAVIVRDGDMTVVQLWDRGAP